MGITKISLFCSMKLIFGFLWGFVIKNDWYAGFPCSRCLLEALEYDTNPNWDHAVPRPCFLRRKPPHNERYPRIFWVRFNQVWLYWHPSSRSTITSMVSIVCLLYNGVDIKSPFARVPPQKPSDATIWHITFSKWQRSEIWRHKINTVRHEIWKSGPPPPYKNYF